MSREDEIFAALGIKAGRPAAKPKPKASPKKPKASPKKPKASPKKPKPAEEPAPRRQTPKRAASAPKRASSRPRPTAAPPQPRAKGSCAAAWPGPGRKSLNLSWQLEGTSCGLPASERAKVKKWAREEMETRLRRGDVSVGWPRPFKVGPRPEATVPPWEPELSDAESMKLAHDQIVWWKSLTPKEQSQNKDKRPDPQDIPIDVYGDPDLAWYAEHGKIIVTFSGGKDSLAMLLYIVEVCVSLGLDPRQCVEVWHHAVDGRPEKYGGAGESEWDWPVTEAYCEAVCKCLGLDLRFNWRTGGLMGTVLRGDKGPAPRAPAEFALRPSEMTEADLLKLAETRGVKARSVEEALDKLVEHDGTIIGISGGKGEKNVRMSFPKQGDIAGGRWCSSEVKIDVAESHLSARKDLWKKPVIICTGERAEESSMRQGYSEREFHATWDNTRFVKGQGAAEKAARHIGFKDLDDAIKHGVARKTIRKVKKAGVERTEEGYEVPSWSGKHDSNGRYVEKWRPIHKWCELDIWLIIARWGIVAHPSYYLGWGRLSCQTCIFGSKHQWATIKAIDKKKYDYFVEMENRLIRRRDKDKASRIATIKSKKLTKAEAERWGEKAGATVGVPLPMFIGEVDRKGNKTPEREAEPFEAAVAPEAAPIRKMAKSRVWQGPIRVPLDEWILPAGAFGEDTGPT